MTTAAATKPHPFCTLGTGAEHPAHHFTQDETIVRCAGFTETLCSWCDEVATHNLDTTHHQCCASHFVQWFTF